MDSKILACALDNMNEAVILDVKQHYAKPDQKPYPDEQVRKQLTFMGGLALFFACFCRLHMHENSNFRFCL